MLLDLKYLLNSTILCVIVEEICKSPFLYYTLCLAFPLSSSWLSLILSHHFPKPRYLRDVMSPEETAEPDYKFKAS